MKLKHLILAFWPIIPMTLTVFSCSSSDVTRDGQQRISPYSGQVPVSTHTDTSVVSIGDSISMSVWDAPQFNTNAAVRLGGVITIPLIGETKVAGYTKEELVRFLRRKLSEYIKGDVLFSVEVISPPQKITVIGQVGRQGSFPVNGEPSLLDVLIAAGGWVETADLRYIKITRSSGQDIAVVEFDLTPFLEKGEIRGMPIIHPGDVVIVPKKENYVLEFASFVSAIVTLFGFFSLLR